jgi:hypothetical protein
LSTPKRKIISAILILANVGATTKEAVSKLDKKG